MMYSTNICSTKYEHVKDRHGKLLNFESEKKKNKIWEEKGIIWDCQEVRNDSIQDEQEMKLIKNEEDHWDV